MIPVLPQSVLRERFLRFWNDKERGISKSAFAEMCGLSIELLKQVFVDKRLPMTAQTQVAVSKTLREWEEGRFRIERQKGRYGEKAIDVVVWDREPKPTVKRVARLMFTEHGFQVKLVTERRGDYSQPTLKQQMEKRRGHKA